MPTMPDLKIMSIKKTIFNGYDLIFFDSSYKKRKNKKYNYEVSITIQLTRAELINFVNFFEKDLEGGTLPFSASFEMIRESDELSDFQYMFKSQFSYSLIENDIFTLELSLLRIMGACPYILLAIQNSLYSMYRAANGYNETIEANIESSGTLVNILISLMNIDSMLKEVPNDVSFSEYYTA